MNYSNTRAAAVTLPICAADHGWSIRRGRVTDRIEASREGVRVYVKFTATGAVSFASRKDVHGALTALDSRSSGKNETVAGWLAAASASASASAA